MSALGATENSSALYARSQARGERVIRDYFPSSVILRPSVGFGPDDKFFNRFATIANISPVLPILTSNRDTGTHFSLCWRP
ncbi:NADH ubiquinone oxidoreductase, putative [invertebrate metagenome]|uniref:NADH ubiquinone oxidoreductase, putative n=1 Tax=invertebrate metagenome TaxID=1711999 RepID=A0A484HAN1_9ZZZZ